jgi:bifunctional UDP-N-acetylglucosamine pyrophosphorylase / glucosamine-1-phosphate N-acetyltransferase
MTSTVAIVLAAGKGTRMKSDLPKVVHECNGRALVHHVLDAVERAGVERTVVVVGHGAEIVRQVIGDRPNVEFALQAEQLGTGHAVMMAAEPLADHEGPVLVVAGDTPLLRSESLRGLLDEQRRHEAACVIGTADTPENQGLGRIVRDEAGEFVAIVEQRDTTPEQAAITEINTGCYAFDGPALFDALTRVRPANTQAEFYLTDAPAILLADGRRVAASPRFDIREAIGVNTPEQLAEVERILAEDRT